MSPQLSRQPERRSRRREPIERPRTPVFSVLASALVVATALAASAGLLGASDGAGARLTAARPKPSPNADKALSNVASGDGARVFVTGYSSGKTGNDYATVAYDTATGARLWASRYNGPANADDRAVAVGRGLARVFVTGSSSGGKATGYDFATVAYDARTGAQLWVARYSASKREDSANALAVSSDGKTIFVTGRSETDGSAVYATVAYDAVTGRRLWVARSSEPRGYATALALSPDGERAFVTGRSFVKKRTNYGTLAYDAATGKRLWAKHYGWHGSRAVAGDEAASLAVNPDGTRVFVTGTSDGGATTSDYATVAYDTTTGAQVWVSRYNGPVDGNDHAYSLAVSADGTTVFVTGASDGGFSPGHDYATLAYNARTGAKLWVRRYNRTSSSDWGSSLALNPDGTRVFVTGASPSGRTGGYATVAYAAPTGKKVWVARHKGRTDTLWLPSLALAPDASKLYITGDTRRGPTGWDYVTVAYDTARGKQLWVGRYNNGPANCVVPPVRGLALSKAKRMVGRAHCVVGKVTRAYSGVKPGQIVSQTPKPGTRLAPKAKVKLVVSRGPKSSGER